MAGYEEWVTLRHPETGGVHECPREAYDEMWAEKGWQLVSSATAEAAKVVGHDVADLRHLAKDELVTIASTNGINVTGDETKAQLVKLVEEALNNTKVEG